MASSKRRGLVSFVDDAGSFYKNMAERIFRPSVQPVPADHAIFRFRKGMTAEFDSKDKGVVVGAISKVSPAGMVSLATQESVWTLAPKAVRISTRELKAPIVLEHALWARVEMPDDAGGMLYGTVTKGGSKVVVMLDGAVEEVRGGASLFAPSTQPIATDGPDEMDRWSIGSYKEIKSLSQETIAFDATILLNGKKAILAMNRGHGGCNDYDCILPGSRTAVDQLEADAQAWMARSGGTDKAEAADAWIVWATTQKRFGVTASMFCTDWCKPLQDVEDEVASSPSPR